MHDQDPVIALRPATPADAAAIADLGARSFTHKFAYLYNPDDLATYLGQAHTEAKVAAEIADPAMRTMLAVEEGKVLGFCKLVMACGWPEHARGAHVIELKQLYLDPDLTGRGLGQLFMDWTLAEAASFGADEVQLSVYSGNDGAQRFYDRHGFGKVADIHFMVGQQRDEEFLFARMV